MTEHGPNCPDCYDVDGQYRPLVNPRNVGGVMHVSAAAAEAFGLPGPTTYDFREISGWGPKPWGTEAETSAAPAPDEARVLFDIRTDTAVWGTCDQEELLHLRALAQTNAETIEALRAHLSEQTEARFALAVEVRELRKALAAADAPKVDPSAPVAKTLLDRYIDASVPKTPTVSAPWGKRHDGRAPDMRDETP